MPYHIVKRGTKFAVEKQDGSKTFGTHDTEAEAKKQLAALNIAEHKSAESRTLHLLGATGTVRTEMFNGREHLVVPVVALMEGVIHAVNAETPEFVPLATLQKAADSWNGRPVTLGHPKRDGKQCSAQDDGILASHGIGIVRNSRVDGKKLLCEAWVEKARAKKLHPDMYARLAEGGTEEVSVGAMVVTDKLPGKFNDKPFMASWIAAEGDHLAFLPGGRGACSVEMGCGTHRAAMRVCADGLKLETLGSMPDKSEVVGGLMKVGTKVKVDKPGHASHGKTGTITASKDGKHTVGAYGAFQPSELRAAQDDGDTPEADAAEEQAELIAYNTIRTIFDGVGDQWDEASGLIDELIADETENPTETDVEEEAEEEVETARIESIRMICQSMMGALSGIVNATYGSALNDVNSPRYMAQLKTATGARHSSKDTSLIQAMHDHTMALGATCDRGNYKLLDGNIKEDEIKLNEGKLKDQNAVLNDPNRFYIDSVRRQKALVP